MAGLTDALFYRMVHGYVWQALTDLADKGLEPSDGTLVLTSLRERGQLEEVGAGYFAALMDGTSRPSRANAKEIVKKLGELAIARKLVQLSTEAQTRFKFGVTSEDLQGIISGLTELAPIEDSAATASQQIQIGDAYLQNEGKTKAPTGIYTIDELTDGGIGAGEVLSFMARSGVGKTIAICNMAYHWGLRCPDRLQVMFSLEMPKGQIITRLRQIAYEMTKQQLRDGITEGTLDPEIYLKAFGNLIIDDQAGLSLGEMASRIEGFQRTYGKPVGMVAIDYLGLMKGSGAGSTYERVSDNIVGLKGLAKRFNASVVPIVQVGREKGGDGTKAITLGSARDSGVIEEASDYVVGMWKKDIYKGDLAMSLLKNRHGEVKFNFAVWFDKATLRITDRG